MNDINKANSLIWFRLLSIVFCIVMYCIVFYVLSMIYALSFPRYYEHIYFWLNTAFIQIRLDFSPHPQNYPQFSFSTICKFVDSFVWFLYGYVNKLLGNYVFSFTYNIHVKNWHRFAYLQWKSNIYKNVSTIKWRILRYWRILKNEILAINSSFHRRYYLIYRTDARIIN